VWPSVKNLILRIQAENPLIAGFLQILKDYIFLRIRHVILILGLLCERILKKAILHRKNSLFYKTEYGAYVGDLFMSIIHTCSLCKVNPFEYLKALQENSSSIAENPEKWMPWNYSQMLKAEGQ
jgi:transposase